MSSSARSNSTCENNYSFNVNVKWSSASNRKKTSLKMSNNLKPSKNLNLINLDKMQFYYPKQGKCFAGIISDVG